MLYCTVCDARLDSKSYIHPNNLEIINYVFDSSVDKRAMRIPEIGEFKFPREQNFFIKFVLSWEFKNSFHHFIWVILGFVWGYPSNLSSCFSDIYPISFQNFQTNSLTVSWGSVVDVFEASFVFYIVFIYISSQIFNKIIRVLATQIPSPWILKRRLTDKVNYSKNAKVTTYLSKIII